LKNKRNKWIVTPAKGPVAKGFDAVISAKIISLCVLGSIPFTIFCKQAPKQNQKLFIIITPLKTDVSDIETALRAVREIECNNFLMFKTAAVANTCINTFAKPRHLALAKP
jgi:hypothetical protein